MGRVSVKPIPPECALFTLRLLSFGFDGNRLWHCSACEGTVNTAKGIQELECPDCGSQISDRELPFLYQCLCNHCLLFPDDQSERPSQSRQVHDEKIDDSLWWCERCRAIVHVTPKALKEPGRRVCCECREPKARPLSACEARAKVEEYAMVATSAANRLVEAQRAEATAVKQAIEQEKAVSELRSELARVRAAVSANRPDTTSVQYTERPRPGRDLRL